MLHTKIVCHSLWYAELNMIFVQEQAKHNHLYTNVYTIIRITIRPYYNVLYIYDMF